MIKVLMIARSTLYTVPGGDSVQVIQTAKALQVLGVSVTIRLTHEKINYHAYDLLHFFNLTRPADILYHVKRSKKPFVLSPIFINYSEYDRLHRNGMPGMIFRLLPPGKVEYLKTIGRWMKGNDRLRTTSYLWRGHIKAMTEIIRQAALLLPNSKTEYERIEALYGRSKEFIVVPNGIDKSIFRPDTKSTKDERLVLCVARIEGIKNQLNLINGLNNTSFKLVLIGSPAPNQRVYYENCRKVAGSNITFIEQLPQEELIKYYHKAKVHVLPSWFETTGLSSLEAAAMGCNIVITNKGDTVEYFRRDAFYCDPSSPANMLEMIEIAAAQKENKELGKRISSEYTWDKAACVTKKAYELVLKRLHAQDRDPWNKRNS